MGEGLDEVFVFLGVDGAGGVDEAAVLFEAGEGVGEDLSLDFCEFLDLFGVEAPAGIDATA